MSNPIQLPRNMSKRDSSKQLTTPLTSQTRLLSIQFYSPLIASGLHKLPSWMLFIFPELTILWLIYFLILDRCNLLFYLMFFHFIFIVFTWHRYFKKIAILWFWQQLVVLMKIWFQHQAMLVLRKAFQENIIQVLVLLLYHMLL